VKIALPAVKHLSEYVQFSGGLDVVTPGVAIPPGFVRDAVNVEEDINGGYMSLTGYERYNGKASPSSALFWELATTNQGTVAVGDTLTGATSGATGVVIAITTDKLILTKVTGIWVSESTTTHGAVVVGPATGGGIIGNYAAYYKSLAADNYRLDISPVPGVGSVLGVWYYLGVVYAFRNKATTGVGMYKTTPTGWQSVELGYEVSFINANTEVLDTRVLTQGAVTATINRVVLESGTLLSGTNTGRLIISTPVGGGFAAGSATTTGSGVVTLSGAASEITIPNQSGRFEFVNFAFTGWRGSVRMYGADGINRAFEFDGIAFVPINCGSGIYPKHVAAHQNHLFVSYLSSVLFSGLGDPYRWTTIDGGGELAFGDDVTGFMSQPGTNTTASLAIYCRNLTKILYGTGSSSWSLVNFSDELGAIPYSIQKVGVTYAMDDRGVTTLAAVQEFGNFANATISTRVKTWLSAKRSILVDSHVSRDKGQYRLFFSDGTAAYWTINGGNHAMMPVKFPIPVTCSCSAEIYGGGDEVIFFGSTTGQIYQLEKGTSFDGLAIEWYACLAYNYSKMYRGLKKYRRMTFELAGSGYCVFQSTYSLGYGLNDSEQPNSTANNVSLTPALWDHFTWDQFVWDGKPLLPLSMDMPGTGENASVIISANSNYYGRLKFSGVFIEFSPLRMKR
jgi:hypothetical protein